MLNKVSVMILFLAGLYINHTATARNMMDAMLSQYLIRLEIFYKLSYRTGL